MEIQQHLFLYLILILLSYDWYVNGELFTSGLNAILPAGDIHVQAVSSSSCYTNSDTISIFQPSHINISQEIESVNCAGGNDGSISVEVLVVSHLIRSVGRWIMLLSGVRI